MGSMATYALSAKDSFATRPLCRVDALCLSWLAYLRFSQDSNTEGSEGLRIADLGQPTLRSKLVLGARSVYDSSLLLQAMAASPRFSDVRACWHVSDSSTTDGRQFSATTFVLPDGMGAFLAFRGTDDTLVGWKENLQLATDKPLPAQVRAASYVQDVASRVEGPLWLGGHSKGGNLAAYAAGVVPDEVRGRLAGCFSFDGPGVCKALRSQPGWHDDVPLDKTVPHESLVGMLFERSQQSVVVVESSAQGLMQHDPFTWKVSGNDFACLPGLDYDAWRTAQRVNDWLDDMSADERAAFADVLAFLMDTTAEVTFSGLLSRWSSNTQVMQTALDAAPAEDRALLERAMGDLAANLLLGSRQEHASAGETPRERIDAAQRRVDDLTAHTLDRLSRLDRLTRG